MVATVEVVEGNGATVTWTVKTSVRLCTKDIHDPGLTFPTPVPAAGNNYSYWKHIALKLSGTYTLINNIKHYSDGAIGFTYGTGGEVRRGNRDSGDHGCPAGDYEQSAGTEGTTGYSIEDGTNGHDYYKGQSTPTANIANDTVGSPAMIDSTSHTTPTEYSKAVVLQMKVATDATRGAQTAETMTFVYDEI